jgi:hypothetical protein
LFWVAVVLTIIVGVLVNASPRASDGIARPTPTPKPGVEELLASAAEYLEAGDFFSALTAANQALILNPSWANTHRLLDEIYEAQDTAEGNGETPAPEAAAAPSAESANAARAVAPARAPQRALGPIPGLAAADMTLNLKDRGYTCPGMKIGVTGGASWDCTLRQGATEYYASASGRSPTAIEYASMEVTQFGANPSDGTAASALGYFATLPYRGSEPQRAREWVEQNISRGGEIKIGNAWFILSGPPRARTLSIQGG